MTLTPEQNAIVHSEGDILINAVAGSGKTTTLIAYARARHQALAILYIAFNKSVKTEAEKKFSEQGLKNVQVETAHSLAYNTVVRETRYKVKQNSYKSTEIAEVLGISGNDEKHANLILANHISKFITYFCNSNKSRVQDLNYEDVVFDPEAKKFAIAYKNKIMEYTRMFLAKMDKGEIEITHDFYLKKFQLQRPTLPFDYILFDEGQDASEAMLDIFLAQPATKVIVGDTHQQIYGWRYAINALEKIDFPSYSLTQSFRFTHEIANLGMRILEWKNLLGIKTSPVIMGLGKNNSIQTKAILARTNTSLLVEAVEILIEKKEIKKLYFEGRFENYTYADEGASIYDVLNLYTGKKFLVKDKLIAAMGSIAELEDYIEKTEDKQLGLILEVVKKYGEKLPHYIKKIKENHLENDDKLKADLIFSTVHRCKGMEYDEVTLANDFINEARIKKLVDENDPANINLQKTIEEINILYVAITRTKNKLNIPADLMPASKINVIDKQTEVQYTKKDTVESYYKNKPLPSEKSKSSYLPWDEDEDEKLSKLFEKRLSIKIIAEKMGRSQGAIEARIKRLQLRETFY